MTANAAQLFMVALIVPQKPTTFVEGISMGILSWIIVGLIAGALAKWIMPGKDPGGILVTMLIGIVGAVIGGFLVGLVVPGDPINGINITTILVATLGAVVLLALYRWYAGRSARTG